MIAIFRSLKEYVIEKLRGEISTKRLIEMGMRVGKNLHRERGIIIDYSHCWLIRMGDNVRIGQRAHILAHDGSTKLDLNYTKIGLVDIGDNVFIGAESIILPNVKIGNNVIIGAGCVVSKNIPDDAIVVGNPAQIIGKTSDYLAKHKANLGKRPVFDEKWTIRNNISQEQKEKMIEMLRDGIGYVE